MRVRDVICNLPASRIAQVSALGFGDPAVIPLWYGEGDLPTPAFIGDAATAALQSGHTFNTYKAGLPELRGAIAAYLSGLHERPVISRLNSFKEPIEFKVGMVFAVETYCPAADGVSAARIEEEVILTPKGPQIISLYPAEELPVANAY